MTLPCRNHSVISRTERRVLATPYDMVSICSKLVRSTSTLIIRSRNLPNPGIRSKISSWLLQTKFPLLIFRLFPGTAGNSVSDVSFSVLRDCAAAEKSVPVSMVTSRRDFFLEIHECQRRRPLTSWRFVIAPPYGLSSTPRTTTSALFVTDPCP